MNAHFSTNTDRRYFGVSLSAETAEALTSAARKRRLTATAGIEVLVEAVIADEVLVELLGDEVRSEVTPSSNEKD